MAVTRRIGLKDLAGLCRRVALSIDAGLDDRAIWQREAQRARPACRGPLTRVYEAICAGESITRALAETDGFFPPLTLRMVEAGEVSGKLPKVLERLADHYEHQLRLRRTLLAGIAWPLIQLAAAIVVVGLLIYVMGVIGGTDLLGFGLRGGSGVVIYAVLVGSILAGILTIGRSALRGDAWARPIGRLLFKMPVVGASLTTLALARLTWTLHLMLDAAIDLRQLLPIALRNSGHPRYMAATDAVVAEIEAGRALHEAMRRPGVFPDDFLQALEAAEESGRMVESMGHLSRQYEEKARAAFGVLSVAIGFAVWALVALLIIAMIFRLASVYIGILNDAAQI